MLRIVPQSNAAAAKGYYSRSDYYAADLDLPARWGGRGAAMLGLSGEVTKAQFDSLCDNLDPRTGQQLTARTRTGRTVLYDFNVHVPKSLSVLIERTDDPRLVDAVRDAGEGMMRELEAEMLTRVRRDNHDTDRPTGNLVWATIPHRTSRPAKEDGKPDPHFHLHVTCFNATHDPVERRWKAGQFRDVGRDAPYWQAQFHARLTRSLTDLGYGIARTATGWEVAAVPHSVVAKFSRRTREVEALAQKLGVTDPAAKAKLGATSRQAKTDEDHADLRAYWEKRLTSVERAALDRVTGDAAGGHPVPRRVTAADAARYATGHSFATASVVPEKRLVAEALKYGVGGVAAEDVRKELNRQGVITRVWDGRLVATSRAVLDEEQRVLAFARAGRGTVKPLNADHQFQRDWLNPGQRAAVSHVLNSQDRVVIVRGAADTGKTTLTHEVVEAIEATGRSVVMLAPSADASRGVLRDEGYAHADTVARFLTDPTYRRQAQGGVIWVDEAGLLGAPTLDKLFAAAADLDARVVLMGDARQHAAVERGAALRVLETLGGVPVAAVTDVRRQTGVYKQAVEALADGRSDDEFGLLESQVSIQEIADDAERDARIAGDYAAAKARGESVLVVSPTHAEADRVTEAIRSQLREAGQLGAEREFGQLVPRHLSEAQRGDALNYAPGDVVQFVRGQPGHAAGSRLTVHDHQPVPLDHPDRFQVYRTDTVSIAAGEQLRITANGWTRDRQHRLDNGSVYTVAGFTDRGDVRLANGWVVDRAFGHWAHGYVTTSHAAQGKTVDRVLVAQSALSLPASSREQFYVSVSRGKQSVTVYTHDRAALRDAVTRSDPRISATELVQTPAAPVRSQPHVPSLRRAVEDRQRRALWERTRQTRTAEVPEHRRRDLSASAGAGA